MAPHITSSPLMCWYPDTLVFIVTGRLPVRGSIPDMTADSQRYIQLQNTYKEQALQDVATVTNYVHQLLQTLGRVCRLLFSRFGMII